MPVVGIPIEQLRTLIGNNLSNEKIVTCCQEIGCDVDEFTQLNRVKCARCQSIIEFTKTEHLPKACEVCSNEFAAGNYEELPPEEVIRLDLLADRPDNFDAGGLARSIRGYLGFETGPALYPVAGSEYEVTVDPSVSREQSYRPRIACAVIKNMRFNDETLKSIMKLQENLHWAMGRDRKYASIGVYNLDTIKTKLVYKAVGAEELKFIPLGSPALTKEYLATPKEVLEKHPKGVAYAHLLKAFDRYPLLQDESGTVLSMPPIINSEDTKVTIDSTNLFIDVTGVNQVTINKVLNILVTAVKETVPECRIHSVQVKYGQGETITTPVIEADDFEANFDNCRKLIGVDLSDEEIIRCLKNMRYDAVKAGEVCKIKVPPYRGDIMHEYDIIEDIAIGYGYKNIIPKTLETYSTGAILPIQRQQQQLRELMTGMGFLEILNIMLTSEKRAYENLRMEENPDRAIIDNPISVDQTIVRTELVSGLMETLANNTNNELPQKIFETGEVIIRDSSHESGTREEIALGAAIASSKAGFADIKAILQTLMQETGCKWDVAKENIPLYLDGRSCRILINGKVAGHMGEVHPEILEAYHIYSPVAVLEINFTQAGLIVPQID